eukprot:IDg14971t1
MKRGQIKILYYGRFSFACGVGGSRQRSSVGRTGNDANAGVVWYKVELQSNIAADKAQEQHKKHKKHKREKENPPRVRSKKSKSRSYGTERSLNAAVQMSRGNKVICVTFPISECLASVS